MAKKQLGYKETPLSQDHTFHIICCVAIFYAEVGDTDLDRQRLTNIHKVALVRPVIPLEVYMKSTVCKSHLIERVAAQNLHSYLILSNWVEADQDVLWPSDSHLN